MASPLEPSVEIVSRDDVKKGLADGTLTLIDVREDHEYAAGHIPGARLMPLSTFDPGALPRDPGKRVVFSCNSGRRTLQALQKTWEAGRHDIRAHYQGSFQDWRGAGEPIETA